ncbi:MAG: HRDC domain-containing protein, partial [Actinomycetota bacterium]
DGSAAKDHLSARARPAPTPAGTPARRPREDRSTLPAAEGQALKVLGGYEGTVAEVGEEGVRLRLDDGGSFFVRYGERVTHDGQPRTLARPASPQAEAASSALRAWRLERAKADGVPAFVVLSDKHLDGIAERMPATLEALRACPGIGPAKLDSYGDEILEVLATI